MPTLVLRLAGPLQSWGTDSRFETRLTEKYPTKSGLIGMIASALGCRRDSDLSELNRLNIGVRIDQPGQLINDFHTARKDEKTSYITRRYYLSDAVFTVGISSEDPDVLKSIAAALKKPVYPLFLGRRSCVPDPHMVLEIQDKNLLETLKTYPFQGTGKVPETADIILEGETGNVLRIINDNPESFDIRFRKYKPRKISELSVKLDNSAEDKNNDHDPFFELEVTP